MHGGGQAAEQTRVGVCWVVVTLHTDRNIVGGDIRKERSQRRKDKRAILKAQLWDLIGLGGGSSHIGGEVEGQQRRWRVHGVVRPQGTFRRVSLCNNSTPRSFIQSPLILQKISFKGTFTQEVFMFRKSTTADKGRGSSSSSSTVTLVQSD